MVDVSGWFEDRGSSGTWRRKTEKQSVEDISCFSSVLVGSSSPSGAAGLTVASGGGVQLCSLSGYTAEGAELFEASQAVTVF